MEENTIKINNEKPQTFEFQLDVEGIDPSNAIVRFNIENQGLSFSFPCEKKAEKLYSVYVPHIPNLEKGTYPCKIEVIIDGYFFTPMTGNIEIVDQPKVTVTPVSATTEQPPSVNQPEESPAPVVPKKTEEERKQALDDLVKMLKKDTTTVPSVAQTEDVSDEESITQPNFDHQKDELVRQALEQIRQNAAQISIMPESPSKELHIRELMDKEQKVRAILNHVTPR